MHPGGEVGDVVEEVAEVVVRVEQLGEGVLEAAQREQMNRTLTHRQTLIVTQARV
jgi:hypothetical protein